MTRRPPQAVFLVLLTTGAYIIVDFALDYVLDPGPAFPWAHLVGGAAVLFIANVLLLRALNARRAGEDALRRAGEELELRVRERTCQLEDANQRLESEIAERQGAEQALRRERDRAETFLNIADVIIVALDSEQRVTLVNARGCEILGCTGDQIIGVNWFDTFLPEDVREVVRTAFLEALQGKGAAHERLVNPVISCGGEQRLIAWHNAAMRDEDGRITGTLSSGQDITEQTRAQEALRNSEEKFSAVFHFSPDPIVIGRVDTGVVLDLNPAFTKTFGHERTDVIGQVWGYLNLLSNPEANRLTQMLAERGQVINEEYPFVARSGRMGTMLVSVVPITVSEAPLVLFIAHDITERKRSEAALREAQAEAEQAIRERAGLEERQRLARELHDSVSQALYGVSLGINTALTLFDVDRDKVLEALHYSLSLTRAGLNEMRALIFELRPESLEMEGLVVAIRKQAEAISARHGIEVAVSLGAEPGASLATKEALYRIAQEALQNAVKHSHGGRLDVRMLQHDAMLTLEVCDNGVGFDTMIAYPGHLGLRSMRERAEGIGAMLTIQSAPGCGTQILVQLPTPVSNAVAAGL